MSLVHSDDRPLILISGWALDAQSLFLAPPAKQIIPISFYSPQTLATTIKTKLPSLPNAYNVLGFSMGALWLSHHLDLFPDAAHIFFAGCRHTYSSQHIRPIQNQLKQNQHACLDQFYKTCCASPSQLQHLSQYHKTQRIPQSHLTAGLTYLETTPFNTNVTTLPNTHFIHGKLDRIAPAKELCWIPPSKLTLMPRMGHCCLFELKGV